MYWPRSNLVAFRNASTSFLTALMLACISTRSSFLMASSCSVQLQTVPVATNVANVPDEHIIYMNHTWYKLQLLIPQVKTVTECMQLAAYIYMYSTLYIHLLEVCEYPSPNEIKRISSFSDAISCCNSSPACHKTTIKFLAVCVGQHMTAKRFVILAIAFVI